MKPLLVALLLAAAFAPDEWQFRQTINVPAAGLVRVNLPAETLNAARPNLADLRVIDASGNEVPYFIDQPAPRREATARVKDFRAELAYRQTILHITTGTGAALAGVTLDLPPGPRFTKAARVEGSSDEITWRVLTEGVPIFRSDNAAARLRVSFPEGAWRFLRVIIDDSRSEPVPVTGADLILSGSQGPAELTTLTIKSREENGAVTHLELDLGAANLHVASLLIGTPEGLFTRHVSVATPVLGAERLQEQTITTAVIYRTETNGSLTARLDVPIEKQIAGHNLILFIENGDDAPLALSSITATRRATRLFFSAPTPGAYTLACGSDRAVAPRYDVPSLHDEVRDGKAVDATLSSLTANPNVKPALQPVPGAPIDLAGWRSRKSLVITNPGPQQLELDTDVLSKSASDGCDLRLVREKTQLPFVLETTSSQHAIPLSSTEANDRDRRTISRWSLKLPRAHLPIKRLTCAASSPAFERTVRLWEEVTDVRGEKYPRELGRAIWHQPAARAHAELTLELNARPQTDTLLLETDNRENAAIDLRDFRGHYPVTRLLFHASATGPLWLFYGNVDALAPHYDLSAIDGGLLRADPAIATLGAEEKLKTDRVTETLTGSARYIFWGVLALVVIVLLALISRLLPKPRSA
ncbi:MAG: hypothetical protein DLM73_10865 [Chthoniobacterales bacterium]|nr:MAG: hypothetical protein DLM73_10865 [Chthoniobacterales bacterium]PZR73619.1 MAG: hypothetical protein DLM52_10620 [Chthoniobacterales bacterium]